jgi:hypothetical protein
VGRPDTRALAELVRRSNLYKIIKIFVIVREFSHAENGINYFVTDL